MDNLNIFLVTLKEIVFCATVRDANWWLEFGRILKENEKYRQDMHKRRYGRFSTMPEEWKEQIAETTAQHESMMKQRHRERYDDVLNG